MDRTRVHARTAALAVVCTVLFVTFLDNTIVSVTLANIQTSLHAGVQTLQWVVNGYALAFASLMLTGGMLGDLFGRKKVMLGGLALFVAGSVIAAIAPDSNMVLVGRVVMGVGAAGSEPGTLSVIRHLYDDRAKRARALGAWAAVSGTALAMGPVVAGLIVGFSDWRGVFWFNLAIGGAAFAATVVFVPESSDREGAALDVPGIVLSAVALSAAIFAVIEGESSGYGTWWIITLLALAVGAAAAFVIVELRASRPLLDLRLFRRAWFATANAVAFTTYFGVFSIFFFVALYLQLLADQSPFATALDFVPMTVIMIVGSALTGRWVAAKGPGPAMTVGCLLGGVGILIVDAVLGPDVGFAQLSWSLAIAGAGFGIALVPVTSAALSNVRPERSGMAASATNTSRELGAVFGVAVLGSLVNAQLTSNLVTRLNALGIPANFQSIVIEAVTHGGVPANAQQAGQTDARAAAAGPIVDKVIAAAQRAFYSGLHLALLVSAAMLLASGVVTYFVFRRARAKREAPAASRVRWSGRPLGAFAEATALVVAVVAGAWAFGTWVGGPSSSSAAPASTTTTTAPAPPGSGTPTPRPSISIQPSRGIRSGDEVTVTGTAFAPGTSLVALECADRGDATSSADCDVNHVQSVSADQQGRISLTMTVRAGPFGAAGRVCDASHPCEVVVSAPSQDAGGQRATAPLALS